MISEAVKTCVDAGWVVYGTSPYGSVYLKRPEELHLDRGIRVSDHARRVKSKYRRKRWITINTACFGWRELLGDALANSPQKIYKP